MNQGAESQHRQETNRDQVPARRSPERQASQVQNRQPRALSQESMLQARSIPSPVVDTFRIKSPSQSVLDAPPWQYPDRTSAPYDLPLQLPPLSTRHQRTQSLAKSSGRPRHRSPEHNGHPYQSTPSQHAAHSPIILLQPNALLPSPHWTHRPAHSRLHSQVSVHPGGPHTAASPSPQYNHGPQHSYFQPPYQHMHGHQQHVRPLAFGHQRDLRLGQYPPSGGASNPGSGILLPPLTSPVFADETSYSPQSESSSRGSAPQISFVSDAAYRRSSTGAYSAEGSSADGPVSGGADSHAASRFNFKREILTRNGMTIGSWTREESDELMVLVDGFKQVEPNNPIPWTRIGRQLRHPRTGAQCHAHYTEALDPKILKGRWNPELDAELLRLAVLHDNSWVKISAELPNKTQRQCRSRWVALLRKRERDQLKTTANATFSDVSQEQGLPSGGSLRLTDDAQAKSPSKSEPAATIASMDLPSEFSRSSEPHKRVGMAPSTESVELREPAQPADNDNE